MSGYIVKLYVEGGDMDGEELACGPYATEDEAQIEALKLAIYGDANVLNCYDSADAVLLVVS